MVDKIGGRLCVRIFVGTGRQGSNQRFALVVTRHAGFQSAACCWAQFADSGLAAVAAHGFRIGACKRLKRPARDKAVITVWAPIKAVDAVTKPKAVFGHV